MLPERITARINRHGPVAREDLGACWMWTGAIRANGYGAAWLDGKHRPAHRVIWEDASGPVDDGHELDHLCRVRACVRPSHLEPVTRLQNLHRSDITVASVNTVKTHCPQNHPYDAANTYCRPNGHERQCRTCMRERNRARRRRAA